MMKKHETVLITGASGFIGRQALSILLENGWRVHAVARKPFNEINHPHLTWHACDLLEENAVGKLFQSLHPLPSHLLHFAWEVTPGKFWASEENHRWHTASRTLFETFAKNGGKRAVFAGSCAEYDWSHEVLSEKNTPLKPDTLYGQIKNQLREELETASKKYKGISKNSDSRSMRSVFSSGKARCKSGIENEIPDTASNEARGKKRPHGREISIFRSAHNISFGWGRIFFLYGPHEARKRLVSEAVSNLLAGEPFPCTEGREERDFMHVADVARAFVMFLESDVEGAVNIASGQTVSISRIVQLIGQKTGRPELIQFGAYPSKPNDPALLSADTAILNQQIGFTPRYSLESGIEDTIQWYRSH